jgi:hypothetical protein
MGIFGYDYTEEVKRKEREAEELRQQVLHDLIASGRSDVVLPPEDKE